MSSIDKELLRYVRKIRDRLHSMLILDYILLGIAAALAVGVLIALLAHFIPIYKVYGKIFIIISTAAIGALLYSAFRTPSSTHAALKADSLGLNERTVTAIELVGQDSTFAMLEKKDALEHLQKLDYRKQLPIRPNRKYLVVCGILIIALAVTGFIPNSMTQRAEELHRLKEKIAVQQNQADKLSEKIKSNPKLTKEQKKELEKKLSELKKELKAAKNDKDIEKALQRAEKKLEYMKKKYDNENLKKIADIFAKNDMTKALADTLKKGDVKALKEGLAQTAKELKKMSPEQLAELAKNLEKLAEELKDNPELKEALSELAQKLADGALGDVSEQMAQLSDSLEKLMQDQNISEALSQLQKEMSNMSNMQNGQSKNGQQDNGFQGQGNQPGNGQGQGQGGNQPGSQGQGQGGGAGNGTDAGSEKQTPTGSQGAGLSKKDGSEKKTGEYEKVFTSQTLGGDGEKSNLSGNKNQGGNTEQVITDKSNTVKGTSVPYDQVMGQYKQKAIDSINSSDIPPGMKDIVKEYFSSLEE